MASKPSPLNVATDNGGALGDRVRSIATGVPPPSETSSRDLGPPAPQSTPASAQTGFSSFFSSWFSPQPALPPRRSVPQPVVAPPEVALSPTNMISEISTMTTFPSFGGFDHGEVPMVKSHSLASQARKRSFASSAQHIQQLQQSARRPSSPLPRAVSPQKLASFKEQPEPALDPAEPATAPLAEQGLEPPATQSSSQLAPNAALAAAPTPQAKNGGAAAAALDGTTGGWAVLGSKSVDKNVDSGTPQVPPDYKTSNDIESKFPSDNSLLHFLGPFRWFNFGRRGPASSPLRENLVESNEVSSKIPNSEGAAGLLQVVTGLLCSSWIGYSIIFAGMASGLAYGVYANRYKITDVEFMIDWEVDLAVAFIGNAYFFVNDIPRVLEAISDGHVYQDSVIHASAGSLAGILLTGNGMYKQWKTDEAFLEYYYSSYDNNATVYDYGRCTVAQILKGYDEDLEYGNRNNKYYNDGLNPCIMDADYLDYMDTELQNSSVSWDFVVLADQTKRMAVSDARSESVYALAYSYAPMLKKTSAIPVIVDTHAFWSNMTNMTGLVSISYFQSLIYDGVEEYVEALASVLPAWQSPIVAPIGIAYMTVYEEYPDVWEKLFIDDMMHASVHGSYLFACVLYATMYGHLPPKTVSVNRIEYLFADSRKLVGGQGIEYPTESEAYYYRNVAHRVALDGFVPSSLLTQEN